MGMYVDTRCRPVTIGTELCTHVPVLVRQPICRFAGADGMCVAESKFSTIEWRLLGEQCDSPKTRKRLNKLPW